MKTKKKEFYVKNNHGKVIKTIVEDVVYNKFNQSYSDFIENILGYKYLDKISKREVPKFILFYKDVSMNELNKKYDRIEK